MYIKLIIEYLKYDRYNMNENDIELIILDKFKFPIISVLEDMKMQKLHWL